jgi:hypothetical protein
MLVWVAGAIGVFLLATAGFVLTTRLIARRKRRIFLEGLGGVVRIGTPCLLVSGPLTLLRNPPGGAESAVTAGGRALVPGTVALTPSGIHWAAAFAHAGQFTFEEIQRLETDETTQAKRGFFRSKVLRVTATSGEVVEFVLSPGHAWEWRQALGEWTARKGAIAGAATS